MIHRICAVHHIDIRSMDEEMHIVTFKSLEAVRDASLEQLANAPSMNQRSAQQVYDFFHGQDAGKVVIAEDVQE